MTIRELIFRAKWQRYHSTAFQVFDRALANERLSRDELLARQEVSRRNLVRAAMCRTEFYRKHYSAVGFEPGDIGKDGWFEQLPIVTKNDFREKYDEFIDCEFRSCVQVSTTGGSTGVPTKTGYDKRVPEEIYSWRLQNWFGVHPWDDHAYIWRDTRSSWLAKVKNAAAWWPTRHLKLDASCVSEQAIVSFLKRYERLRPSLVYGYVGAVTQVAEYILQHRCGVIENPNLRFVWVTSAPLSPVQRRVISSAFGVPVCDQYGSCEVRAIAQQCPAMQGLHVNTEHVHIEFVDESNVPVRCGDYGRTLLTNLEDTVFPIIRYENGDRGRWLPGQCSCGRSLPCIDSVKGRECESFVLPSGRIINGEFLTTIFDARPDCVKGFRIIQKLDKSVVVEYVPNADEQVIIKELKIFSAKLGNEVPVSFVKVPSIQHDRGKNRFVVVEGKQ